MVEGGDIYRRRREIKKWTESERNGIEERKSNGEKGGGVERWRERERKSEGGECNKAV